MEKTNRLCILIAYEKDRCGRLKHPNVAYAISQITSGNETCDASTYPNWRNFKPKAIL